MLLLLLLPFLLHLLGLGARDVPKDTKYVIKKTTSCPDVGYYFRREASPNSLQPGPCFLCFCQDDGTAVCWERENKRCDLSTYQHHDIGKRETRVRRSPFGLGEIFFRDAARDLFGKNTPQTCKPFETSFSEGCPPADWCIGCSVCDCDAHGHWDCHILSFCPDKDDKNIMRTAKKSLKKPSKSEAKALKAYLKNPMKTMTTTKSPKVTPRVMKSPVKPNKVQNKTVPKRPNRQTKNKNASNTKSLLQRNNNIRKNNVKASPKPLIIRKNVATRKPVIYKTTKNKIKLNATEREVITQEVIKRVVNVMQRMLNKSQIINNQLLSILPGPKNVQKRSMDKKKPQNFRKNVKKYKRPTSNKSRYNKPLPKRNPGANRTRPKRSGPYKTQSTNERYKRNVLDNVTETYEMSNTSITETHTNMSTKVENYYKYAIVTHKPTNDTNLKENEDNYHIIYVDGFNETNSRKTSPEKLEQRINLMAKKFESVQKSNTFIFNEGETNFRQMHEIKNLTRNSSQFDLLNYREANKPSKSKPENNVTDDFAILTNNLTTNKYKVRSQDVERIVRPHLSKYNSSNIVNTLNNKLRMLNISNSMASNIEKSLKTIVFKRIEGIQNVLKRFLNEFHSNHTKVMKFKRKRFNIIKYLKKFFKNIFWKRNTKVKILNNSVYEKKKLKSHIIKSVCEVFGNCYVKKSVIKLIEPKISKLHVETNKILRIIKTIKGLLHLIEFSSTLQNETEKTNFKDDISKLNYILKNQYNTSEKVLTQNQIFQINYLKNNVELFIQEVGKFASILNDIIAMLTNKHANNKMDVRDRRNMKKDYFPNVTKDFDKLKNVVIKYKLMQNDLIKKLYDILSKFEKSQNNSTVPKVSYQHNNAVNTTVPTEHISRNFIKNLRKLKNLAEILNSSRRKKRDVMREDDTTIEYLLTLMEYMLKQNYPLDVAPVNDGIDLLIEAIKNAPDIKPIEKKVLKSLPSKIGIHKTDAPSLNVSQDESLSDSSKDSAEDNVNVTLNPNGTRLEASEQDKEYKYETTEENPITFRVYNQESVFYDGSYPTAQHSNELIETTLSYRSEKINDNDKNYKIEKEIKVSEKYDIFSGDIDDDEDSDIQVTSTTTERILSVIEVDSDVESTTVKALAETSEFKLPAVKLRHYNIDNREAAKSRSGSSDKRVAFDWLGDEQDMKEANEAKDVMTTVENITKTKTTVRPNALSEMPILQKHVDNISSMTKELSDEDRTRQTTGNTDELMYKKQMDLLNSLDYGTEKSELEDSNPKEEAFMSYYS